MGCLEVSRPHLLFKLALNRNFTGAVIALVAACCAQISPVREFGLRLGMMWTIASLPLLAGPQICGVLVEAEKGYTGFSIFSGVSIIAGSLTAFAPVMWKRYRNHRKHLEEGSTIKEEKA
jgi:MCP family monocarboxylic acid transporter-like MFS transporter 10